MAKIDLRHAYCSIHIHPSNLQSNRAEGEIRIMPLGHLFYQHMAPFSGGTSPGISIGSPSQLDE